MMRHINGLRQKSLSQGMACHAPTIFISVFLLLIASIAHAQDTIPRDSLRERILTLDDTRPIAYAIVLALSLLTFITGLSFVQSLRQRFTVPWRISLKLVGWIIPLITALIVCVVLLNSEDMGVRVSPLQILLPAAAAIHAALLFSPDDEPLDVLLALPRPITWLVVERFVIVALIYSGIGGLGMGLMAAQGHLNDGGALLAAWAPSMLFLMSFALYIAVRTRVLMMGLVSALGIWLICFLFNGFLMPGSPQPFPMNYVQPLLWMINIFAQPQAFPEAQYYTLNRVILLGLTVFWLWLTAAEMRSPETLMLSIQNRQMRRKAVPAVETLSQKRSVKFPTAPVALSIVRQIMAMWLYEWKLHWRRRPLKVILLTLTFTAIFALLISHETFFSYVTRDADISQIGLEQYALIKGMMFARMSFSMLTMFQMLGLPLILADAVALDEQDHMREMLSSMPLPGWAYLAGKIGGVWWAGMSAIGLALTVMCLVILLATGIYNPIPLIDSWLLLSAPILLFNSGFMVLVGATQPTRRRAAVFVIGVVILSIAIGERLTHESLLWLHLNPFDGSLLINMYDQPFSIPASYTSIFTMDGVTEFLIGRGVVFLLTALTIGTWWTLRWSGVSLRSKASRSAMPTPLGAPQQN